MDPVIHAVLLGAALLLVTIVGVLFLQEEGKRRYIGVVSLAYVVGVAVLLALAMMGV